MTETYYNNKKHQLQQRRDLNPRKLTGTLAYYNITWTRTATSTEHYCNKDELWLVGTLATTKLFRSRGRKEEEEEEDGQIQRRRREESLDLEKNKEDEEGTVQIHKGSTYLAGTHHRRASLPVAGGC